MSSKTNTVLPALILSAFAAQPVSAHDVILNNTIVESQTLSTVLIQHSCDATTFDANGNPIYPEVIAYSFVFPTVEPVAIRDDNGEAVDLSNILQNYGPGIVTPFWDTRIFKTLQLKKDSLGNNIGFSATGGHYQQCFNGEVPLFITPLFFWDADSAIETCATQVTVKPVAADICKITPVPATGDANIWMEHTTAKFPNSLHGIGENEMRLVFKRDLEHNPLPASCNGKGFSVTVTASDKDIDANLPIPNYWPAQPKKGKPGHK
ncbi:hypothetical protein [Methyloterricola oryzae]|uniref:hypothetical protein n=1 Tax=Methyloterricola oryzae TaxID=1495050 RepID=UPI0005EB671E|nr:hypothetical protein [Methyloterricola oryzae]